MRALVLALVAIAVTGGRASAYPQFQLARDPTCTGCHLAPDGGGILNENGIATAEAIAWKPGDGSFMYGMSKPSWLQLGGDVRGAAGFVDHGSPDGAGYPMQAELAGSAGYHGFSFNARGGLRTPQDGGSALHVLWSREHYLMWQQKPDSNYGLYVRVGRLMPTFGLRLAEHVVYTERFGGYPLYGEAYAAAASYVVPAFEVHLTAFMHDPVATAVEHGDGGAAYVVRRLGPRAELGADWKYSSSDDQTRMFVGLTGKVYFPKPDLLLQAEGEVIRQRITAGAGDRAWQLAGYLLASHPLPYGLLLDAGIGHYTQDTRVEGLTRDCIDANLHWFATAHIEGLVTTRLELLDVGRGNNGGYVLAQVHYRL